MLRIMVKTSPLFFSHMMTFSMIGIPLLKQQVGVIPVMAMLIPIWISSSVLFSEWHESYAFLRTLPVRDRDIVHAKFLLTLLAVSVYCALMVLIAVKFGTGTAHLRPNLSLVLLGAITALVAAAVWYMGIWLFGTTVMTVIIVTTGVVSILFTVVLRFGSGANEWHPVYNFLVVRALSDAPWYVSCVVALAGLAAFYGLMQLAFRVKERSDCFG
jgi:hypothetical protein